MKARILLVAVAALLVAAAPAAAHPLGNFSVNHLAVVSISDTRIDVRYVLDQAEIPTFRERGMSDAEVLRSKQAEVERRLVLTVDGRTVDLAPAGSPPIRPAACAATRRTCWRARATSAARASTCGRARGPSTRAPAGTPAAA
jgi:hypothetical protein